MTLNIAGPDGAISAKTDRLRLNGMNNGPARILLTGVLLLPYTAVPGVRHAFAAVDTS